MRAMLLVAPGRPLDRREVADPEPGPGEVLLRVRACGVCRTDLHIVDGELAPQRLPLIPGHEIVGEVERCGAGVGARRPAPASACRGWPGPAASAATVAPAARTSATRPRFTG